MRLPSAKMLALPPPELTQFSAPQSLLETSGNISLISILIAVALCNPFALAHDATLSTWMTSSVRHWLPSIVINTNYSLLHGPTVSLHCIFLEGETLIWLDTTEPLLVVTSRGMVIAPVSLFPGSTIGTKSG